MKDYELEDAVLSLHNIARLVETKIGRGILAEDLRQAANTLSSLIKYYLPGNHNENNQ